MKTLTPEARLLASLIPDKSNTATLSPGILKCFQLTFTCFCVFKIFVNIFPVVSVFNNSVSYFYFAQFMEKYLHFHLNSGKHLSWWTHVEHVINETFFLSSKKSSRRVCKTSSWETRLLANIPWRRLQNRLEAVFGRYLRNTSLRHLEDVLVDEKLLRWRRLRKQEMFAGLE